MRRPVLPRSVGFRIFASFTSVMVALTSLFSFLGLQFAQKTIDANARNELRLLSVVLSRQVQRQLSRIEETLGNMEKKDGFLAGVLRQAEPDGDAVEDFLLERVKATPLFKNLAVYDRVGQCIGATDDSWYDLPVRKRPFFVSGLKGFTTSDMFAPDEGRIQLVSVPIVTGNVVRGVLMGQVNMSSIYDLMDQKLGLSETTDAFLLDNQLRFITPGKKTSDERHVESHLKATPLVRHLNEESIWADRYKSFDGQEVLGTVFKVPGRDWYVVVERDIAEVIRPLNDVKKVIGIVALSLTCALILTTFLLSRSITKPLSALVEGTQQLAQGDFNQPIAIPRGPDEVAFLASEIDKMRARILAFQESLMERLEESERQRIDSQRLAAIGTLASTMAHEIRNPLNAMSLLLSRLELAKAGNSPTTVVRDLRGEIARLDRLVSDILDYARPLSLQYRRIDVAELIRGTIAIYQDYFDAKRITCRLTLPDRALRLRGDPDKLRQCLVNLLQNSIDALSPSTPSAANVAGGGVTAGAAVGAVEAAGGKQIDIDVAHRDGLVEIKVSDNGVGLPAATQGRLFDLFFTTKERGTGLGLTTVKKIVDAHGGQITLAQRVGAMTGTEVRLVFREDSQI